MRHAAPGPRHAERAVAIAITVAAFIVVILLMIAPRRADACEPAAGQVGCAVEAPAID